ncbi:MAG: proton-conducting transporter membrane subunit [Planctomycetota bacterium]
MMLSLLAAVPLAGSLFVPRLAPGPARAAASLAAALAFAIAAVAAASPGRDSLLPVLAVDELNGLLLPFVALLFGAALLATPRTDARPGALGRLLLVEGLALAFFACVDATALCVLWWLNLLPIELEARRLPRAERRGIRVARVYLAASGLLFTAGVAAGSPLLLLAAIMIRKGIVPLHSWMPEWFATASLPAAVLFAVPQLGTLAAARLIFPFAAGWILDVLGSAAVLTALYAAGVALVQRDGRRAFAWIFMSQSALVLAGLEGDSAAALTGGLILWISSGLALGGFGLTLAILEARRGRVDLARHHGGHESMPLVAASFLLLGLCSVGFPATLGFVGAELLLDGTVSVHPLFGIAAAFATVLNGISALRMYFLLFCGARTRVDPALRLRLREHAAVALLAGLVVGCGLFPQPIVHSRSAAADRLMHARGSD